jgi:hypothetical protein
MGKWLDQIANAPGFKPFMKKITIFAAVVTLAGVALKLSGVHAGETLLITGMGTLSVVAFFLGWAFPGTHRIGAPLWKFAMTLTGYSLAAVLIGLLFVIMHWPGGDKLMIIGAGCLVVSGIAWLVYFLYYKKNKDIQIFEEENN